MDGASEQVAELLRLGDQKAQAYRRKDELETQLMAGGTFVALFRGMFPSEANRAKREEHDETVREIELLRIRMDELHASLPSERRAEVQHLWSYENTTSLSQIREHKKRTGR